MVGMMLERASVMTIRFVRSVLGRDQKAMVLEPEAVAPAALVAQDPHFGSMHRCVPTDRSAVLRVAATSPGRSVPVLVRAVAARVEAAGMVVRVIGLLG